MTPTAAPARFPYYEHRTLEQVEADAERIERNARYHGLPLTGRHRRDQ